nr:immunoglobulin heavy chain junction region [Macaca mulatta]
CTRQFSGNFYLQYFEFW